MKTQKFKIAGSYIELIKLLKATGICAMGSDAKYMVSNGNVLVNGSVDLRLRAKIRPGDSVEVSQIKIEIQ